NLGNSGGPLVNLQGEVIGINSRGIPGGDGLGFAIPAHVVKHVYEHIVEFGRVKRSWIGIDRGLQPLGFDAPVRGIRLGHVAPGSPAAKAGLKPGDILTTIGGDKVDARFADDIPPIRRLVSSAPVDELLKFDVTRGDERLALEVRTRELTATKALRFDARRFGCTVRDVTARFARRTGMGTPRGVLVTGVVRGGPAAVSGLRTGDVILALGKDDIAGLNEFENRYDEAIKGSVETVLVNVWRNQRKLFRVLKPAPKEEDEDE
ncbi:MAG: PDZ domain-containing protein, partial [Planctomycetota bacterium]|nr:PDZ domain-containing protein [Planctomycetota bacterium]